MKKNLRTTHQKEIPPLLERYELKYLIPVSMIDPISDYLSIYCTLDKYSQLSDDEFYTINSLYCDTPDFLFLKRRLQGADNRFNMRIRSYDSHSGHPCFFEIKQKKDGVIRKYRAAVSDKTWAQLFTTPGYNLNRIVNDNNMSNVNLFYQMACTYQIEPKVLTHYRRKAWVSDVDDYARATFDRYLSYQDTEAYNLIPSKKRMLPYDHSEIFDPHCNVVLELKCYASMVPVWMIDLISYFNLQRRSFSKYANSVIQAHGLDPFAPLDRNPLG